jgi:hypothetical protein
MEQDPIQCLCLAGLTVLPIPDVENNTDIYKDAKELLDGGSTQETLIYRNATTAHLDALTAHIDAVGSKALADYLNAVKSLGDGGATASLRATSNYKDALNSVDTSYPGLVTFFGSEIGLLFFKMSSIACRTAQSSLQGAILNWIGQMGLGMDINSPALTAYKPREHSRQKHAWSFIQPSPPRWTEDHFPTVLIEAGVNKMLLRMEKDWWFTNSQPDQPQGDIKIVLLINVDGPAKSISIELWDRDHPQSPSQTVTISPHPEEPLSMEVKPPRTQPFEDSRWVVKGAPIEIPFERVFLRPKKDGETGLVIAEPALIMIARKCWQTELMSAAA